MIEIEHDHADFLVLRASGSLTRGDYEAAVPELENGLHLRAGLPARLLVVLEDFRGWEIGGLWQELKFDLQRAGDFGRIAVVGEGGLEEWGTKLAKPFFRAEMRYFDRARRAAAEAWLAERPPRGDSGNG